MLYGTLSFYPCVVEGRGACVGRSGKGAGLTDTRFLSFMMSVSGMRRGKKMLLGFMVDIYLRLVSLVKCWQFVGD